MRYVLVATLSIALMATTVVVARAVAGGAFRPAAAAERELTGPPVSAASATPAPDDTLPVPIVAGSPEVPTSREPGEPAAPAAEVEAPTVATQSAPAPAPLAVTAAAPDTADAAAPSTPAAAAPPAPAPAPVVEPAAPAPVVQPPAPAPVVVTPAPAVAVITPAPAPVVTPAPAPVVAAPAPAPAPIVAAPAPTCDATWFCYPRLGIAGPIVPYGDCLGSTDIGEGIRSFTCISPFYLMGHAYTQFGAITGWQAGDVVFASGRRFVIAGAFVQNSCEPPAAAIAPLSLQTSLTSGGCGRVLVVQGS